MYSYLFIDYFERFEFGSNNSVLRAFSILPPIIRFKTLTYLYGKYPENICIIDKLVLAILKAFHKENALKWIDERKEKLETMRVSTGEADQDLIIRLGPTLANRIINSGPTNMYAMCLGKIESVAGFIDQNGKLYTDFEGAIELYRREGIINGTKDEIVEFNSIMDFCYLGRKSDIVNINDVREKYLVIDFLSVLS